MMSWDMSASIALLRSSSRRSPCCELKNEHLNCSYVAIFQPVPAEMSIVLAQGSQGLVVYIIDKGIINIFVLDACFSLMDRFLAKFNDES